MNNIEKTYKQAVKLGLVKEGKKWYKQANTFALELSTKYFISTAKCAGIIAALSPGITWDQNKKDAEVLAQSYYVNEHNEVFKYHHFSTYGRNVLKAIEILNSDKPPIEYFSNPKCGFKTRAFYQNILEPNKTTDVTIDRHSLAVALGFNHSYKQGLTKNQYNKYATMYVETAKKLNLLPHELQAITWVVYKQAQDNGIKIFKS